MRVLRQEAQGNILAKALGGNLAEDFDATALDPRGHQLLVLDLSRITGVSSFGVREWVRAASQVGQKTKVFHVQASPRMTDQFNMIAGFDCGGVLLSFFANYFCESCRNETTALFDTRLDVDVFKMDEAPARQCRSCGKDAQLDDIPEALFEYVRNMKPPAGHELIEPWLVRSWLDVSPGRRFGLRRVAVEGNKTTLRLSGMIDESFAARRLVEGASGELIISLSDLHHVSEGGVAAWSEFLRQLSAKCTVRLVSVPPVMSRRLADGGQQITPVEIASGAYPIICKQCNRTSMLRIDVRETIRPELTARVECQSCKGGPHVLRVDAAELNTLHATLSRVRKHRNTSPQPQVAKDESPALSTGATDEQEFPPFLAESSSSRYEMLVKIGEGGMASVYLVRQHGAVGFRRPVVVKVVRAEFLTDDRVIRMFLEEARLAARIDHPNIIRVHDLGRTGGSFFMVMDFVHGRNVQESIEHMVHQHLRWPPALAASIVADLCGGLARAHVPDSSGRSLVHRDITPNNVILRFDGVVKLIDFGLAGYRHFLKDPNRAGQVVGNLAYLAPEAFHNEEATPALDLWGAGLMLAYMLTGKHPFKRDSVEKTITAITREPPDLGKESLPKSLACVISKSLAKQAGARYESAAIMEAELRNAMRELERDRRDLGPFAKWFGRKVEPDQPPTVEQLMRRLFSHQIRIENEFAKRVGAANFADALLDAQPRDIARFFRALGESRSAMRTQAPDASISQPASIEPID